MRGTSQASHDAVLREFDPVATAAGEDGITIAEHLFVVVDALDTSGSLRRALTDPARPGKDKASLVTQLFGSLDQRAVDAVSAFASSRWSDEADLAESIEDAGEMALFAYSDNKGTLQNVEDELFRVERLLEGHRELLTAMSNRSATKEQRLNLLEETFGSKLHPTTHALLARVVAVPRGRRLVPAIKELLAQAAERRGRTVASVTSAVELSAAQRTRLASILASAYGREVQINVAVDPEVLGGIRVQVGSEVVDGTIISKLDDARRRLVG
ncbi:F0F1 ATP synthase subunit delta [Demequina sp. B12]|uniref:F0F1 ATP synthase subunit delta n=1 Tax=Demequina sp. B12 TaxID=2992757 RepID=UPI00237BE43E|nr:F0F1 ATP synthase subunit delta [Demequina sp. B12]MDE0573883.1 F0F1 ATP synthase subunit delta [Demequina sp. B12]